VCSVTIDEMTLPPNSVVLVTGGTGLVGSALKYVIENEPVGSKFGKSSENEQWIFLTSKDGDLR
jgi:GDP-L-fucose synthase